MIAVVPRQGAAVASGVDGKAAGGVASTPVVVVMATVLDWSSCVQARWVSGLVTVPPRGGRALQPERRRRWSLPVLAGRGLPPLNR